MRKEIIRQDKIFGWIALATGAILLIPLIMMQISDEWHWQLIDFVVIGMLLFGMSSFSVLVARKLNKKYWLITSLIFVAITLYIWAELAVGIFTNFGS